MAETQSKPLNIETPNYREMEVEVEGLTPLLQNKFSEQAFLEMEEKQTGKGKGKKEARNPERVFREATHVLSEANGQPARYGHPAVSIREAMASASHRFVKTNTGKIVKGAVQIRPAMIPIDGPEPEMQSDPAKIPGQSWTIAYRPCYWPWKMVFTMTFDAGVISRDEVVNLLIRAGRGVGIGAWRTENGGDYGQFTVVRLSDPKEVGGHLITQS